MRDVYCYIEAPVVWPEDPTVEKMAEYFTVVIPETKNKWPAYNNFILSTRSSGEASSTFRRRPLLDQIRATVHTPVLLIYDNISPNQLRVLATF